jgi:type I restriction-modification system DNA methylase subunit
MAGTSEGLATCGPRRTIRATTCAGTGAGCIRRSEEGYAAEELVVSRDEYTAEVMFWVPLEVRWHPLKERPKQREIGKLIDQAMDLMEIDTPSLRAVRPKTCARPSLDVRRLGERVDQISRIGMGSGEHPEKHILGRWPKLLTSVRKLDQAAEKSTKMNPLARTETLERC